MKNLFLPFVVVALFAIGSCGDEASVNPPVTSEKTDTIKSINDTNSLDILIPLADYNSNTKNFKNFQPYLSTLALKILPDGKTEVQARNGYDSLYYIIDPFRKEFQDVKFLYYGRGGGGDFTRFICNVTKIPYTKNAGYLTGVISGNNFKASIDTASYFSELWHSPANGEKYGYLEKESFPFLGAFTDSHHFSISVKVE